eukprot:GHVR01078145.1.p2 GENE.GHVR01078145.1~~GHVR01078145.1.p2  ORF type:complete len:100 (+),score=9.27 GHVR01078145.1:797-1096(+)
MQTIVRAVLAPVHLKVIGVHARVGMCKKAQLHMIVLVAAIHAKLVLLVPQLAQHVNHHIIGLRFRIAVIALTDIMTTGAHIAQHALIYAKLVLVLQPLA